jgi:hypothetical protein
MAKEAGSKKISQREMQEILIENFVGLQKAMTNMSIRFESLSDQIRKLLEVFELSAKSMISQAPDSKEKDEILGKINNLLDQNKTIARGLVVLEDKLRSSQNSQQSQSQGMERLQSPGQGLQEKQQPRPLPRI